MYFFETRKLYKESLEVTVLASLEPWNVNDESARKKSERVSFCGKGDEKLSDIKCIFFSYILKIFEKNIFLSIFLFFLSSFKKVQLFYHCETQYYNAYFYFTIAYCTALKELFLFQIKLFSVFLYAKFTE